MNNNITECTFNKNYDLKISKKLNITSFDESKAINHLVIILNYSFLKQNNFFIPNFNKKNIIDVCVAYNQLKTNILNPEIYDIFHNISIPKLKMLRFIILNYINNFEVIEENNKDLCGLISKDILIVCSRKLSDQMKTMIQ